MISRLRLLFLSAAAALTVSIAAPARADAPGTIVDVAAQAGTFTKLLAAAKAADLVGTLAGKGPFTVFAPTDDAFAKLPKGTLDSLLLPENVKQLRAILLYHVVPLAAHSADLKDGQTLATVQGASLTVHITDTTVRVNDATVLKADIPASNGVIHVIDTVLLPK